MLLLFVLTLLILGLLAFVARALARIALRPDGQPAPRLLAGVLSVAGLGAIGATGLALLGLTAAMIVGTVFVEHGPVRSVELVRAEEPLDLAGRLEREAAEVLAGEARTRLDPRWPLHLVVDWEGRVEPRLVERFLRRELDWDVDLVDARRVHVDGEDLTRLDFGVDVSRGDLDELELALASFGDLPRRVRLEIDSR